MCVYLQRRDLLTKLVTAVSTNSSGLINLTSHARRHRSPNYPDEPRVSLFLSRYANGSVLRFLSRVDQSGERERRQENGHRPEIMLHELVPETRHDPWRYTRYLHGRLVPRTMAARQSEDPRVVSCEAKCVMVWWCGGVMVDRKSGGSKGQNEIGPHRSFSRAVLTRTVTTVPLYLLCGEYLRSASCTP